MSFIDHMSSGFRQRIPALLLVAAAIACMLFGLWVVPWYTVHAIDGDLSFKFAGAADGLELHLNVFLTLGLLLALIYFAARMFGMFLLIVLNGPTSTRKVAWLHPTSAHLQGLAVLVLAIVAVASTPSPTVNKQPLEFELHRGWGAILLIVGLVLAQIAITLLARKPALGATQGWNAFPGDEAAAGPAPRAAKQQRPMLARAPPPPSTRSLR